METHPIQMDRIEAGKLLRKYQEHRAYSTPADEEIMRIYRAISKGKVVVAALAEIVKAGADERGLPKLAIARADTKTCFLRMGHDGAARMSSRDNNWWGRRAHSSDFDFDADTFARRRSAAYFRSIVPLIPPDIRPRRGLANYHILFEAEWSREVPVDPILLRRLGKADMWIVLGAWDLTPVERAVLAGRVAQ